MVYKRWGVGPRGGTSSYKNFVEYPAYSSSILPLPCKRVKTANVFLHQLDCTSKKNRFAVVRGYRSKRRLLNLLTMAIDDYYYLLFVFQSPTHRPARPQFQEKALGDLVAGRRARTSTLFALPKFLFSFFSETYDTKMIFQVTIRSIF